MARMGSSTLVLLAIALGAAALASADNLPLSSDLTGNGWHITNGNGSISVDGSVPGYALEALHAAGKAPNPLERFNEVVLRWTASETWVFERLFNVSASMLAQDSIDLVMHGVDTVADIYVNNQLLLSVSNAHREYRIPVKGVLNGTAPAALRVVIKPAEATANARAANYSYGVPGLTQPGGLGYYNFLRKPASDFGWDWGPAFTPAGIYGAVELQAYSGAFLTAATPRQERQSNGSVLLSFDAVLHAPHAGEHGTLQAVSADGNPWSAQQPVTLAKAGENVVTLQVMVNPPFDLWWPAGYGGQPLYAFELTYAGANASANSSLARAVGFRTIELVRDARQETFTRDVQWENFFFRVNGVPVYAKGSNAVPVDIFHSRMTPQAVRRLVADAAAANMNMLRVWGGGLYYRDEFYDACDAAGLMVWQEAMFACSLYPANQEFLDDVREEITYNARRISGHASLAIWGGGNEVEASFQWFDDSREDPRAYTTDYMRLFVYTIREALLAVDPHTNFVDSSPSNQLKGLDPYTKRWGIDASDPRWGDGHYYDYGGDCLDTRIYPRSKFVSEFGFQSYPSFNTVKNQTAAQDWSYTSPMMNYRQRKDNGNPTLFAQVARNFHMPPATGGPGQNQANLFQQWIYLTQVTQARCYEAATSYWRRIKSDSDAATMGVLYWQLNDIWAAPSWSSTNYGGEWKLLHYAAKKFFAPLIISADYDKYSNLVTLFLTSDVNQAMSVNVTVELVAWNATAAPAVSHSGVYALAALGSKRFLTFDLGDTLHEAGASADHIADYFLHCTASASATADGSSAVMPLPLLRSRLSAQAAAQLPADAQGQVSAKSIGQATQTVSYDSYWDVFPVALKDAPLPQNPGLSWSGFQQVAGDNSSVSFTLASNAVAAFVALESTLPGRFSDNSFVLLPWANRTLTFTGSQPLSPADLRSSLSAMSVADTLTPAAENNAIPSVNTFDTNVLNFIAGVFEGGVTPTMDPLALSKSAGIVPRVASCSGTPNPCALTNSTQ